MINFSAFHFYSADVKCARCKKVIPAFVDILVCSEEYDDEGREWRSFCPECSKLLQESNAKAGEVYNQYPVSEMI